MTYCGRFMRAFAATTQLQERWWGKHKELVSGGPPYSPMLRNSCGDAKIVNSLASNLTSQFTILSRYRYPGRLLAGALI
jgi:hypothetical protein